MRPLRRQAHPAASRSAHVVASRSAHPCLPLQLVTTSRRPLQPHRASMPPNRSASEEEYCWGNKFQGHARIAEQIIEREKRRMAMAAAALAAPANIQGAQHSNCRRGRPCRCCCARLAPQEGARRSYLAREPLHKQATPPQRGKSDGVNARARDAPGAQDYGPRSVADAGSTRAHGTPRDPQVVATARLGAVRVANRERTIAVQRGAAATHPATQVPSRPSTLGLPAVPPGCAPRGFPASHGYGARVASRVLSAEGWSTAITTLP
jgi:hypothetical protein